MIVSLNNVRQIRMCEYHLCPLPLFQSSLFFLPCKEQQKHKQLPFLNFYVYFEGSPPAEEPLGAYDRGVLPIFFMFPQKEFVSTKHKRNKETKKRVVYGRGGSCTHAFSWGSGTPLSSRPRPPLPQENTLIWEPPLQHEYIWHLNPPSREHTHMGTSPTTWIQLTPKSSLKRTHSYGNLPYNMNTFDTLTLGASNAKKNLKDHFENYIKLSFVTYYYRVV